MSVVPTPGEFQCLLNKDGLIIAGLSVAKRDQNTACLRIDILFDSVGYIGANRQTAILARIMKIIIKLACPPGPDIEFGIMHKAGGTSAPYLLFVETWSFDLMLAPRLRNIGKVSFMVLRD